MSMNMGRLNPAQTEQQNPLFVTYQNPGWPPNAINSENVLHYFCDQSNPFYDRTSDNEQLKMQNMGLQNLGAINHHDLTRLTGTQYAVVSSCPPLHVICKQKRNTPNNVTPLCYYYVLNGIIYQAPDLYSCVQSRLVGAVEPLKKALQQVLEMSRFNVTKGTYTWDFKTEPANQKKKSKKSKSSEDEQQGSLELALRTRATPYQTVRTEMLLRLLHEQFPGDSQSSNIGPPPQIDARPASSLAEGSALGERSQQSNTASPAPFFQHPQLTAHDDSQPPTSLSSHLDLPPVLQSLPSGVSQMASDALSRLQAQTNQSRNDDSKMEVDQ
ncbi:Mediator of RNA polymerase II transcription subunit 6 [Aphelenchoides bicaudatus]|nr:Mediator of RNA polymerase II transcription subunit 6 [Aphelenchoides bicaudatus]